MVQRLPGNTTTCCFSGVLELQRRCKETLGLVPGGSRAGAHLVWKCCGFSVASRLPGTAPAAWGHAAAGALGAASPSQRCLQAEMSCAVAPPAASSSLPGVQLASQVKDELFSFLRSVENFWLLCLCQKAKERVLRAFLTPSQGVLRGQWDTVTNQDARYYQKSKGRPKWWQSKAAFHYFDMILRLVLFWTII